MIKLKDIVNGQQNNIHVLQFFPHFFILKHFSLFIYIKIKYKNNEIMDLNKMIYFFRKLKEIITLFNSIYNKRPFFLHIYIYNIISFLNFF